MATAALAVLLELARRQRQPVQTVLKQAIDSYRWEKFLEEANAALPPSGSRRGTAGPDSSPLQPVTTRPIPEIPLLLFLVHASGLLGSSISIPHRGGNRRAAGLRS